MQNIKSTSLIRFLPDDSNRLMYKLSEIEKIFPIFSVKYKPIECPVCKLGVPIIKRQNSDGKRSSYDTLL